MIVDEAAYSPTWGSVGGCCTAVCCAENGYNGASSSNGYSGASSSRDLPSQSSSSFTFPARRSSVPHLPPCPTNNTTSPRPTKCSTRTSLASLTVCASPVSPAPLRRASVGETSKSVCCYCAVASLPVFSPPREGAILSPVSRGESQCPLCLEVAQEEQQSKSLPNSPAVTSRDPSTQPDLKGKGKAAWSGMDRLGLSLSAELEDLRLEQDMAFARQIVEEDEILIEEERARREQEEERMFQEFLVRDQEEALQQEERRKSLSETLPTCDICKATITFEMIQSGNTTHVDCCYLENCNHMFCRHCILLYVQEKAKTPTRSVSGIKCPACVDTPIAPMDLQSLLPTADYDRLLNNEFNNLVTVNDCFVKCPSCSIIIERDSRVPEGETKPQNLVISGVTCSVEAFEHHQQQRFRCRQCSTEFCASCLAVPYHLGKTCEEFKTYQESTKCRFCDTVLEGQPLPKKTGNSHSGGIMGFITQSKSQAMPLDVCNEADCQQRGSNVCTKTLSCGHPCCGIRGERNCLPCLQEDCPKRDPLHSGEDFCCICYSEVLRAAPCIRFDCGHIFHCHCMQDRLAKKWPGARISFGFMACPQCGSSGKHPALAKEIKDLLKLKADVMRQVYRCPDCLINIVYPENLL